MCANILDCCQCMYDPSFLISPAGHAATALCTDDAATAIPTSGREEERNLAQQFLCRDSQNLLTDFKGRDINQDGCDVIISQSAYVSKLTISETLNNMTKMELHRPMTTEEVSKLRPETVRLS